ncbi:hypothetical protein L1987_16678 [Smallanthus sonchifolius]|uniref:Uncharacterized protein n=1 Tax=Smallanthus sonchifolius TaxID=185202 RepID=A0ACB9IVC0_9ASTR|nr:hypothetical protein L1987_16678 [Smallanthus sonchifolius]
MSSTRYTFGVRLCLQKNAISDHGTVVEEPCPLSHESMTVIKVHKLSLSVGLSPLHSHHNSQPTHTSLVNGVNTPQAAAHPHHPLPPVIRLYTPQTSSPH